MDTREDKVYIEYNREFIKEFKRATRETREVYEIGEVIRNI